MSETKFTPGHWVYAGRLGFGHLISPNIAVAYGGDGSGRADDGLANANLIAAAPDLYAALCDLLENEKYQTMVGGNPRAVDAMLERARAALSKARGQT